MPLRYKIRILSWTLVLMTACEYPFPVDIPDTNYPLVVDGFITTDEGPYTVKLQIARPVETQLDNANELIMEEGATIFMKDDQGSSEQLKETAPGVYQTSADGIRGQVGRKYHIEIKTSNGKKYSSLPEEIMPVGSITDLMYEFKPKDEGSQTDYFSISVNATGVENFNDLIRFRMIGTYEIETHPERATIIIDQVMYANPYSCSGYIVDPSNVQKIKKVGPCECCTCWVNTYNDIPTITDEQLSNNIFRNIEVGKILINPNTFSIKHRVEVQQLSLTPFSYNFWKLIRAQKIGATDLFQPSYGKVKGNIISDDGSEEVLGIFWAAGINKKAIYLKSSDVPYVVKPYDAASVPCYSWDKLNSVTTKPSFWID